MKGSDPQEHQFSGGTPLKHDQGREFCPAFPLSRIGISKFGVIARISYSHYQCGELGSLCQLQNVDELKSLTALQKKRLKPIHRVRQNRTLLDKLRKDGYSSGRESFYTIFIVSHLLATKMEISL